MLREKIKDIVEEEKDPEQASLKICKLLEEELDLSGNGWFDGDEKLSSFINNQDDK